MISEVIPVFSRKVLFGYEFMAAATMAIAFISLGVWAHHMFTRRHEPDARYVLRRRPACWCRFRPASSSSIGWRRCTAAGFRSPRRCCSPAGFLSMFLIGGLTGIMLAAGAVRFSAVRQLFRRRAFSLGADRRHAVRRVRGHSLLVSQGDRPDALRAVGPLAVLAAVHRLHPDVRADAHLRACWACRGGFTLTSRPRLGDLEPARHDRRGDSSAQLC